MLLLLLYVLKGNVLHLNVEASETDALVVNYTAGMQSPDPDIKAAAEEALTEDVFWTAFGHKYHIYEDCSSLKNSATLYNGSVTAAIDNGRGELCYFCANRAEKEQQLKLDGLNVEEGVEAATGE